MNDVQDLLRYLQFVWGLISLRLIYILLDGPKHLLQSFLPAGALLIVILAFAIFLPFETLFHAMHIILFPQGNWQFPTDSVLISLFPGYFFAALALRLGVYALIGAIALINLSVICQE